MQKIGKFDERINAIPNNVVKYMAFMLGPNLVFIDSFHFLSRGLDSLVRNLPSDSYKYTSEVFNEEKGKLATRKGFYPYDYVDSFERFGETRLPKKEGFYSALNDEHISDEDYEYAQNVWRQFKITNIGEHHDLFLKTDDTFSRHV